MEKSESFCLWPILAFWIPKDRPILDLIRKSEFWQSFRIQNHKISYKSKQETYLPIFYVYFFIFYSVFSMEKSESCCVWPILVFWILNDRPILDLIKKRDKSLSLTPLTQKKTQR